MLGTMCLFAGNFAPRGFAFTDGQLLSIAQNSALFSILGTTYGGDGRTTFALPHLRGRVAMHAGHGPGLSDRRLGSKSGQETVTLTEAQLPSHDHSLTVSNNNDSPKPQATGYLGSGSFGKTGDVAIKGSGNAGGGQAHNNLQPYQCVNFIIALQGLFPSRS